MSRKRTSRRHRKPVTVEPPKPEDKPEDPEALEQKNPGILDKRFPKLLHLGQQGGINPKESPMLIYPTLHYQNGGVVIDSDGRKTYRAKCLKCGTRFETTNGKRKQCQTPEPVLR